MFVISASTNPSCVVSRAPAVDQVDPRFTDRLRALSRLLALVTVLIPMFVQADVPLQQIRVVQLPQAPTLDGYTADWEDIEPTVVTVRSLDPTSEMPIRDVTMRVGIHQDQIHFLVEWPDPTHDLNHKDLEWNAERERYVTGASREDRLALQFEMSGEYNANWFEAKNFTADMWHWKSARSNPLGLVHDKITVISEKKLLRAYDATEEAGRPLFIQRRSDAGGKLYKTLRYHARQEQTMPRYELQPSPEGSVADVAAKGIWSGTGWTLEMRRKLDTGYDDDVVFAGGKTIRSGLSVWDHSVASNHLVSATFELVLP